MKRELRVCVNSMISLTGTTHLPHVSIAGSDDVRVWTSNHRKQHRLVNVTFYEMEDKCSYQKVINDDNNKKSDNQKNNSSNNNELADAAVRDDEEEEAEWDDDDFELNDFDVELKIPSTKTIKDGAIAIATDKDGSSPGSNQGDDWLQSLSRIDTTPVPSAAAAAAAATDGGGGSVFLTKQFQRLCTPVSKKKSRCAICTRPKQQDEDEKSSMYCKQCEKKVP